MAEERPLDATHGVYYIRTVDSRRVIRMLLDDGWSIDRVRGDHHQFRPSDEAGSSDRTASQEGLLENGAAIDLPASWMGLEQAEDQVRFPIWIEKEPRSDYSVLVPDLAGCFTAGVTLDEAVEMAREAILCHLEGLIAHGDDVPEQRPLEEHQANPEYRGGAWAIADVDLTQLQGDEKAQRINITLPRRVLHIIDEAAKRAGETRSGYLARAGIEAARRAR